MAKKNESYNNLIDVCLKLVEDAELAGKANDQFGRILSDYFFQKEKNQNRAMELFLGNLEGPPFLKGLASIFEMSIDDLKNYVNGSTANDSLAGKIMLSQQYLKAFYPHHTPSFNKLPEDVRFELLDIIKEKNETIVTAFEKMLEDRNADKKRKVLTLVALIIKNIHFRSGAPFNVLAKSIEETIRSTFRNTDDIFTASQKQLADLQDSSKVKQMVKTLFMVKQFKDITGIADMFKEELERYRKRTIIARS